MKRFFIPLNLIEIYDEMHELQEDGSFIVDGAKDGKSTEDHMKDIKYIKSVIKEGKKTMPILVKDNDDGSYTRLDGFKRCVAYKEMGHKNIEAFVCSPEECANQKRVPFLESKMICFKGGQPKEFYSLFEGKQDGKKFDYDKITFLYKSKNPHGLRIEIDENIHIHFGRYGKYRLTMGREDFINLAESIIEI